MTTICDDGWSNEFEDAEYVNAFEQLSAEVCRPVDKILKTSDIEEFRPKYRHHQRKQRMRRRMNSDDDYRDMMYGCPEITDSSQSESEDRESQRVFFRPPLQIQRNKFARDVLFDFKMKTRTDMTKMCIMGCGEMSLERFLIDSLSTFGVKMLLSVDFDEKSLSVGQQLLGNRLKEQQEILSNQPGLPVLLRSFCGNILDLDYRFANADCIVSLEVIEHMPLDSARQFIYQILSMYRPRIFIFSTPNNDYNEAFGDAPNTFRHDDHKFEMGIKQFAEWKKELTHYFGHVYDIEGPVYIGQIGDKRQFDHLKGATQAMICRVRSGQYLEPYVHPNSIIFQTVSHAMCPIGSKPVMYRLLQKAFINFVDSFSFCEMALSNMSGFKYWSIDVKRIIQHIHAPVSFVAQISQIEALKMLEKLTHFNISTMIKDNIHWILIPHFMKKQNLLKILQ